MRVAAVLLVLCAVTLAYADTFGVNVTGPVTQQQFGCMKQAGINFAVIRCGRSVGLPDVNCAKNIIAAKAANITTVDAYLFPCLKCGNATAQVQKTIAALENQSISHLWVTVENPKQAWGAVADNVAFLKTVIAAAQAANANVGVYTTLTQWAQIMGSFSLGGSIPLWYAHWDNQTSWADFKPFGGWTQPTLKQYEGGLTLCGVEVDRNWAGAYNPTTGPSTSVTASSTGKTTAHTNTATATGPHTTGPHTSGPHTSGPTASGPHTSGPTASGPGPATSQTSSSSGQTSDSSGQTSDSTSDSSGYTTSTPAKHDGPYAGGRGSVHPFSNKKVGGKQTVTITDEQIKKFEF